MGRAGIFGSARVASGGGITATFQQTAIDTAALTTYTFSAQPVGTASPTRRVVVAVGGRRDGSNISTVTIGGVSATIDASAADTNDVAICSAVVPTGVTADVVVTWSGINDRCSIGLWTLSDGGPTGQAASVVVTDPAVLDVTTTTGDVVIATVFWVESGGVADWTGATERYDEAVEGTNVLHSGADTTATGVLTSISVSTTANNAACAAAYA